MQKQMNVQPLLLNEIVASPFNPRKFFEEQGITELAESIREKGLLQPIIVRPKGKQFEIVCGERRFRASKVLQEQSAEHNTINVLVKELSDQEVREVQLIENFQREDVHPMEEAIAIKAAIDAGEYSYEDIAVKVGKKVGYLRQRIKLNDLTAAFQKLFNRNGISMSDAFKLCVLPSSYQREIFVETIRKDDGVSRYSIEQWVFDKYEGDLSNACFSLTDALLDKKMGACSGCQFNSSVNKLFPELEQLPRCSNISCFKRKSDRYYELEFKKAANDPSILLVYESGYGEPSIIDEMKKDGLEVLKLGYGDDCKIVEQPVNRSYEEYAQEFEYEDGEYSEEELRKGYQKELKQLEKQIKDFETKVSTAKYKNAFVVYDYYGKKTGRYVYVELNEKTKQNDSRNAIKSGNANASDIDAEIIRIKEREKRSKELDGEKVWKQINELRNEKVLFHDGELSPIELTALVVALYGKIGYSSAKKIEQLLNKTSALSMAKSKVSQKMVNKICRYFIAEVLSAQFGSHISGGNQCALKAVIESYLPDEVKKIEEEQIARATKREQNVTKRIDELKATKKKLSKILQS